MNYSILTSFKKYGNPVIGIMDKVLRNKGGFQFKQVSDSFYRGSDATNKMSTLAEKGVKTILNLKTIGRKEVERLTDEAKKHGITFVNVPLNPFSIEIRIPEILKLIKDASKENPLFVHCTFGRDRTGFVTALYKHVKEKLPMKEAISDMHQNGFRRVFYNMERYLKTYGTKGKNA